MPSSLQLWVAHYPPSDECLEHQGALHTRFFFKERLVWQCTLSVADNIRRTTRTAAGISLISCGPVAAAGGIIYCEFHSILILRHLSVNALTSQSFGNALLSRFILNQQHSTGWTAIFNVSCEGADAWEWTGSLPCWECVWCINALLIILCPWCEHSAPNFSVVKLCRISLTDLVDKFMSLPAWQKYVICLMDMIFSTL